TPPASTLFPYTTLFRSGQRPARAIGELHLFQVTVAVVIVRIEPVLHRHLIGGAVMNHHVIARTRQGHVAGGDASTKAQRVDTDRSEEHTSEHDARRDII